MDASAAVCYTAIKQQKKEWRYREMKTKVSNYLALIAWSVNYVIISYALSNMAMLLRRSPLFILFFASEVWIMGDYWQRACELTKRKVLSAVLLLACFAVHIGMVYGIGRVVGDVVPFRQ